MDIQVPPLSLLLIVCPEENSAKALCKKETEPSEDIILLVALLKLCKTL